MLPGPDDYYAKNCRKHPNFSINKKRQYPNLFTIKSPYIVYFYEETHGGSLALEKYIDSTSMYSKIDIPDIHLYQVTNEGQENKMFIIGDSHGRSITYHFQKLF